MGQDISRQAFTDEDFAEFTARLRAETEQIEEWFANGTLAEDPPVGGFELEAWLTDPDYLPAPLNDVLLERMNDPLLTTELSRFNVELNTEPRRLDGNALSHMEAGLERTWRRCRDEAAAIGARLVSIGILPTVGQADLTRAVMTPIARFAALNEQILKHRNGRALRIDISGHEHFETEHPDLMLESAATSFQVHMQIPASRSADYFNAALLSSAPLVAVAANSPYLFGQDLWAETRIPLFEQAVEVGGFGEAAQGPPRRVGFGTGYVRRSVLECFRENLEHFPILLPMGFPEADRPRLPHLQLQNGTIWRWNRPLLGFDGNGVPHVRIEHRVLPGGPTVTDELANAAFHFGLAQYFAYHPETRPAQVLDFAVARDNFYRCARHGLEARVTWTDGAHHRIDRLIRDRLLMAAREGLIDLGLDPAEVDRYLAIVEDRVTSGRNGAAWQRAWVERHGRDMAALTAAYAERQAEGEPVHCWSL